MWIAILVVGLDGKFGRFSTIKVAWSHLIRINLKAVKNVQNIASILASIIFAPCECLENLHQSDQKHKTTRIHLSRNFLFAVKNLANFLLTSTINKILLTSAANSYNSRQTFSVIWWFGLTVWNALPIHKSVSVSQGQCDIFKNNLLGCYMLRRIVACTRF